MATNILRYSWELSKDMSYKVYTKFPCFCLAGTFQSLPPVSFTKPKQNHLVWKNKIFDRPFKLTLWKQIYAQVYGDKHCHYLSFSNI